MRSKHPHGHVWPGGYNTGFEQSLGPTTESLAPAAFVSPSQEFHACPFSPADAWAPQAHKDWFWLPPYIHSQGLRARHSSSTWITLFPASMFQGWEWHRLPSCPGCPAKGPGALLPKPFHRLQAGYSRLQPRAVSSSLSPWPTRPPSLANSAHAHIHHAHTHK